MNLTPKRSSETIAYTMDFTNLLAQGETLENAEWFIGSTADSETASMLRSDVTIDGAQVSQLVGGGLPGVTYIMLCKVTTSAGQVLVLPEPGSDLLMITDN